VAKSLMVHGRARSPPPTAVVSMTFNTVNTLLTVLADRFQGRPSVVAPSVVTRFNGVP
jgi:hypothetical protein